MSPFGRFFAIAKTMVMLRRYLRGLPTPSRTILPGTRICRVMSRIMSRVIPPGTESVPTGSPIASAMIATKRASASVRIASATLVRFSVRYRCTQSRHQPSPLCGQFIIVGIVTIRTFLHCGGNDKRPGDCKPPGRSVSSLWLRASRQSCRSG